MPKAIEMTHLNVPESPYYLALSEAPNLTFVLDLNDAHILNDDIDDQEFVDLVKNAMENDDLRTLNIRVVPVVDLGDSFKLA